MPSQDQQAFAILGKYKWRIAAAEHDEIWIDTETSLVSTEDIDELERLGYTMDDADGFHAWV